MRYPTILLALFCAACGSYSANLPSIKPYKMDIQQGNFVDSKMMMQLRPGMSKSQVRFIMGTPLLVDNFHANRWDYFYQMRKEGRIIEQRRVTLEFDGDSLARVRGDVIPAGSGAPVPQEAAKPQAIEAKSIAKPKEKEKGWLDKLKFWENDETDTAKVRPKSEPAAQQPASPPAKPESKPVPVVAPAPVAAPENTPAADNAAESSSPEAPLPPLMDSSMEPKPEPETVQAQPPAQPTKPAETKATAAPAAKPVVAEKPAKPQVPEAKAMTAPPPPNDLPPEDAPDFFEKMLEKIGF